VKGVGPILPRADGGGIVAFFQLDMIFSWLQQGWSEGHVYNGPSVLGLADYNLFFALCTKRAAVLGNQGTIIGYRVRQIGAPGTRGMVVKFGNLPDTHLAIPGSGGDGDSPSITYKIGWTGIGTANQTQTFMRGMPDFVVAFGGLPANQGLGGGGPLFAAFLANLQAYLGFLSPGNNATWGWWGSTRAHKAIVLSNVQALDGTQTITFKAPIFQTGAPPGVDIAPGTQVNVRFAGGQRDNGLSRTHAMIVGASNVVGHTYRPVAYLAAPPTMTGTYNEYGFNAYGPLLGATSAWTLRHVGTRRVGRQFFVLRGRGPDR
jgi:hypothetical protein